MVTLAILVGLYLIGAVGYYKLVQRMAQTGLPEVSTTIVVILALLWPIMTYYSYLKEALR